jgi:hypothetical protein
LSLLYHPERNTYRTLSENLKGKDQFGDLGVDERLKLKWILDK